jgi:glycosyltransferase involved in cell wall biosynthesis
MEPLVSVLIPCYNAERWLSDTLKSVVGQSWKHLEVILVDDGSRDRSFEIARSFESTAVKVIQQENQGASAARNQAYAQAQGDFIQHLDADDFLSPDKIEAQIELFHTYPPTFLAVSATMYFFDGQNPAEGKLQNGWPLIDTDDPVGWLIELLGPEQGSMVQPGSWLTPRSIADRIGPWNCSIDPSPDVDGEYFARAVLASRGIRRSARGLNYYRQFRRGSNMSAQKTAAHQRGALRSLDLITEHLLSRTKDPRAAKALARLYMDRAVGAYPAARDVTQRAMRTVAKLGGTNVRPYFGTWKGELLARVFGWKAARCANHYYHQWKP